MSAEAPYGMDMTPYKSLDEIVQAEKDFYKHDSLGIAARIAKNNDEPYKSTLTDEQLDKWFRDNVWNARNTGSNNKQLYIMREGRMVSCWWWVANRMWTYRRGKSGKLLRRPSKHYDDCMRIIDRFASLVTKEDA